MKHYHVVENTPGYLPESEAATFTNRHAAERYASSLADELTQQILDIRREQGIEHGTFTREGSARKGLIWVTGAGFNRVVEILECEDDSCDA